MSGKALRAPILAAAAHTGEPPPMLAERVGVAPSLATDPDARVPHAVVARAWEVLSAHARAPHLGLTAAMFLDAAPLDLVDVALGAAPTLGAMMTSYLRYQRLFHDANDSTVSLEGDVAVARFHLRGVPRCRPLAEFVLASWVRRAQRLAGPTFRPIEIRFVDADVSDPAFHRALSAPVRGGADHDAIVLTRAQLDAPLLGADAGVIARLTPQLDRALARDDVEDEARARLRELLAQLGPAVSAAALARALGVSTRTLQRRLGERGTRFAALLDDARRERALAELERPDASIAEVAFVVGFADLSAFARAFRRWTGTSPARHRRDRGMPHGAGRLGPR